MKKSRISDLRIGAFKDWPKEEGLAILKEKPQPVVQVLGRKMRKVKNKKLESYNSRHQE